MTRCTNSIGWGCVNDVNSMTMNGCNGVNSMKMNGCNGVNSMTMNRCDGVNSMTTVITGVMLSGAWQSSLQLCKEIEREPETPYPDSSELPKKEKAFLLKTLLRSVENLLNQFNPFPHREIQRAKLQGDAGTKLSPQNKLKPVKIQEN